MEDRKVSPPVAPSRGMEPADLSAEIIAAVERGADERVTCKHVSGNNYRCNWWAPESLKGYDNPMMPGLLVTTHRIRRSRFLNVIKGETGLVIEDCSRVARR